jgi:hypothetical protein
MNLMYKPFSIVSGLVAGKIATKFFSVIWGMFDDREPPDPEHHEVPIVKLTLALLIEGALFAAIRGLIDHGSRRVFRYFTGEWPGDEAPSES